MTSETENSEYPASDPVSGRRPTRRWLLIIGAISALAVVGLYATVMDSSYPVGFSCQTWIDDSAREHPYVLYVPYDSQEPHQPWPVIVFLNGLGENGNDGFRQISNNFGLPVWETRRRFPFVCLATQMETTGAWTDESSAVVQATRQILSHVIVELNCDPDRVYLTGPSSGGEGVYALASKFPQTFAAIAPIATGAPPAVCDAETIDKHPLWCFYNRGDRESLVRSAQGYRRRCFDLGLSPLFTEYDGVGHDCWNAAYRSAWLYDWFLQHSRQQRMERGAYELLQPDTFDLSEPPQTSPDGDHRITIEDDGPARRELAIATQELHFDYRSRTNVPCELRVHVGDQQYAIAVPSAVQGSPVILDRVAGRIICSGDPVAQRALREHDWNDVRIQIASAACTVTLNGSHLMTGSLGNLRGDSDGRTIIGLVGATVAGDQEFRFVRFRVR